LGAKERDREGAWDKWGGNVDKGREEEIGEGREIRKKRRGNEERKRRARVYSGQGVGGKGREGDKIPNPEFLPFSNPTDLP
jgi:hypothetical protein